MDQIAPSAQRTSRPLAAKFAKVRADLASRLIGRSDLVDRMLIALLVKGHILIEGAPGLAKTRAVKLFATAIGARFSRIQSTPDLLPADLTGTDVFRPKTGTFDFVPGPLFANIVLLDEVNRAPPKVQSALLEAMGERQISTGGKTRRLETPFLVAATQNPIEHEGTYPLPEAQLDRFLFFLDIPMPNPAEEREILDLALGESANIEPPSIAAKVSKREIAEASTEVAGVFLSPAVRDYIVRLTGATRGHGAGGSATGDILHSSSPRGSIGMAAAAQALAWLDGRDHVLPSDVRAIAADVLSGRIALTYRARAEGRTARQTVNAILDATPIV